MTGLASPIVEGNLCICLHVSVPLKAMKGTSVNIAGRVFIF
jgi:hypothetical protein